MSYEEAINTFTNDIEWKIVQDKIEFEENRLAESIMSLGNGYMEDVSPLLPPQLP